MSDAEKCEICGRGGWCEPVGPTITTAEINALPDRLRRYIHDLETNCDPAGVLQSLAVQKENALALAARVRELEALLREANDLLGYRGEVHRDPDATLARIYAALATEPAAAPTGRAETPEDGK